MNKKPVNKQWLYKKYVKEKMGSYSIAKLVKRNPKTVYEWLVDFKIPIRKRKWTTVPNITTQKHQNKKWLYKKYVLCKLSAGDIAKIQNVTEGNILFFLRKHNIKRRTIRESRKCKYWGVSGEKNGMFGRCGKESPAWRGGSTPLRQKIYASLEWKRVARQIYKRDKACKICGSKKLRHIHHILPFSTHKKLRLDPLNLILLCHKHHKQITGKELLWTKKLQKLIR